MSDEELNALANKYHSSGPVRPWEVQETNQAQEIKEEAPLVKEIEDNEGNEEELTGDDETGEEEGGFEDDGEQVEPKAEKKEKVYTDGAVWLKKLVTKPYLNKKTGKWSMKPVFKILETYDAVPSRADVETLFVPFWGGGEYLMIDVRTKKVVGRHAFDGEPLDPENPEGSAVKSAPAPTPASAPAYFAQAPAPAPAPVYQEPAPTPIPPKSTPAQAAATPALEKLQAVMASGQVKAVEALNALADKMIEVGNMEGLEKILDALTDIATGKKGGKESSSSDKLLEYLMVNQKSQQDMLISVLMDKNKGSNDAVAQSMGMVREMLGVARELSPPGEDKEVAMAREIGDVVKDSMKEVTDTVRDVTGSGTVRKEPPQKQVVYHCSKCNAEVNPSWKLCPECGLVFSGKASPAQNQSIATVKRPNTAVETFQAPAPKQAVGPRIPPGIRDKLGMLKNVAVFIRDGHDPIAKASGAFKLAGPEQRVQLLFVAEFGYKNLMKLANAYRNSPDIPERDAVFQLVESEQGEQWLKTFFNTIKGVAREEMVSLTDGDREHFINQLNEASIQKFNFKAKPALTGPPMEPSAPAKNRTRVVEPPNWKEARMKPQEPYRPEKKPTESMVDVEMPVPLYDENGNQIVATVPMPASGAKAVPTTCPVCGDTVMTNELKAHLFEKHPKRKGGPAFHEVGNSVQVDESEDEFGEDSLTG